MIISLKQKKKRRGLRAGSLEAPGSDIYMTLIGLNGPLFSDCDVILFKIKAVIKLRMMLSRKKLFDVRP